MRAGVAAGIRVVGFVGGSHTTPGHAGRLVDAGAVRVIGRMTELPGVLEDLAGISASSS